MLILNNPLYDKFQDIENLKYRVSLVVNNAPSFFKNDMVDEFGELIKFCDQVLTDREKSKFFAEVSPYDLTKTPDSQQRAVTIDPDHLVDVENSIVRSQEIYVAGLVKECSGGSDLEIVNCNHRKEASVNAIANEKLPQDFKMPVVKIPYSLSKSMDRALNESQDILNSGLPKKPSNTNDMIASMEKTVRNLSIDLNDDEDYEEFVRYYAIKYPDSSVKTLKTNATRIKNKKNLEQCDVWCDSTKNYMNDFVKTHGAKKPTDKSDYYNIKKDGSVYKNCVIRVVSTKGSSYDQVFRRDLNFNFDNPDKRIVHLVVCQVNKGDSQTTLTSRKTYFKHLYNDWSRYGKHIPTRTGADLVIIVPQNKGSIETKIYGNDSETVTTAKEIKELKSNWRLITRSEILAYFQSDECDPAAPYKVDWIVSVDE